MIDTVGTPTGRTATLGALDGPVPAAVMATTATCSVVPLSNPAMSQVVGPVVVQLATAMPAVDWSYRVAT